MMHGCQLSCGETPPDISQSARADCERADWLRSGISHSWGVTGISPNAHGRHDPSRIVSTDVEDWPRMQVYIYI